MRIILGSSSPRRRELLGIVFEHLEVVVPEVEEIPLEGEAPKDFCLRASSDKMDAVLKEFQPMEKTLIVTSDTVVALGNTILGKPRNRNHAFSMIKSLSGKKHRVFSSISLTFFDEERSIFRKSSIEETFVKFRELHGETINKYLELTEYCDKAGAYAIQENGELIIEYVRGSQSNVMGFPMGLFFRMSAAMNILSDFK